MDLNYWNAPPLSGIQRLSISTIGTVGDSLSPNSTADATGSVTSESVAFSPCEVKSDPDDATDVGSHSPAFGGTSGYDASPDVTAPMASREDVAPPHASPMAKSENAPAEGKKRRGRPRKNHPVKPAPTEGKVNHGRSKTGCITCRRRKKKCDEAKPECNNCKKNNVACEGYKVPTPWQAGRQRSSGNPKGSELPPLMNGIEDELDSLLLRHFRELSELLYVGNENEKTAPINALIVPLTLKNRGLMHAVLHLSGFKLYNDAPDSSFEPYSREEVWERTDHHGTLAFELLRERLRPNTESVDDSTLAHIMMLFLGTIEFGDHNGESLQHLKPLAALIQTHRSQSDKFQHFADDFLMFHSTCSNITCKPSNRLPPYFPERFQLPSFVPPEAGSYFGILDGLFLFLHQIRELRDKVRECRAAGIKPLDFRLWRPAEEIDAELRKWTCHQPENTTLETASLLYHICTSIYLRRTTQLSIPQENLRVTVDEGLRLLTSLRGEKKVQAVLVMPLFLLGCSAFEPYQRPAITETFDVLLAKRGRANIQHARSVVEAMWSLMDAGEESESQSWDWEGLMDSMGLDIVLS